MWENRVIKILGCIINQGHDNNNNSKQKHMLCKKRSKHSQTYIYKIDHGGWMGCYRGSSDIMRCVRATTHTHLYTSKNWTNAGRWENRAINFRVHNNQGQDKNNNNLNSLPLNTQ